MDTPTTYDNIVKQVILRYSQLRPSHGDIRLDTVFDDTQKHYALMQVGWDRERRVRGNLIYITIHHGKVCIEYDGIEQGITQELIGMGIPEQDITLAWMPESQFTISA
jgi:hypothetical protein